MTTTTLGRRASAQHELVQRVRAEYLEMPGLTVTSVQAQRLWGLSPAECESLLDRLVQEGFLHRARNGTFIRN